MTGIKRILARFGFVYRAASFCYQALRRVAGWLFCLCPLQRNKIVIDNFCGKGFGGHPARIAETLLENGLPVDMVWLTADRDAPLPEGIRRVEYGSLRALYETVTASVWIDNVMGALNAPKRKGQLYLNTWHGAGIGLKKVEAAVEEYLEPAYVRGAKKDAEKIDYLLSATRWQD
ncbi:MAG: CDP-glycerol glycerophosphotransferase family protein, partial [Clostridia bacterium]|nr:CDP-glycerol glycerophosphotransferase family protein [Clostridia bacterium]